MNSIPSLEVALSRASEGLRAKMLHSVELIRKAQRLADMYDPVDGFFLAFSGGKDSQALYHITQLGGGRFKAHFSPTTVDPPAVIKFIHKQYPDVIFEKVTKSIYQVAVEKNILPTQRVRWCCAEFKEQAGAGKVTLIGIRKAESVRRSKRHEMEVSGKKFSGDFEQFTAWQEEKIRKKYKNLNQDQFTHDKEQTVRCINGKDSILVSPIIEWTEQDVWEFLNKVVCVPHCELYDQGWHRLGCICCPMSNRKQKQKELELYPYVKRKWLNAIKLIRIQGGVSQNEHTHRSTHTRRGGQWASLGARKELWGVSLTLKDIPNADDIIAENIFDWWISGKNYEAWYAEKFLQRKIEFEDD